MSLTHAKSIPQRPCQGTQLSCNQETPNRRIQSSYLAIYTRLSIFSSRKSLQRFAEFPVKTVMEFISQVFASSYKYFVEESPSSKSGSAPRSTRSCVKNSPLRPAASTHGCGHKTSSSHESAKTAKSLKSTLSSALMSAARGGKFA